MPGLFKLSGMMMVLKKHMIGGENSSFPILQSSKYPFHYVSLVIHLCTRLFYKKPVILPEPQFS